MIRALWQYCLKGFRAKEVECSGGLPDNRLLWVSVTTGTPNKYNFAVVTAWPNIVELHAGGRLALESLVSILAWELTIARGAELTFYWARLPCKQARKHHSSAQTTCGSVCPGSNLYTWVLNARPIKEKCDDAENMKSVSDSGNISIKIGGMGLFENKLFSSPLRGWEIQPPILSGDQKCFLSDPVKVRPWSGFV